MADGGREREPMSHQVAAKEARKIRARKERGRNLWFGLGLFGVVGWSVSVPALIGVAVGLWIDGHYPSRYSWTLTLLFVGVVLGCLNAWYWVSQERPRGNRRE